MKEAVTVGGIKKMIDILNRSEFVNNVFKIIERLAEDKKNCAFAIEGEWGSGKTFVLNMLDAKLSEAQSADTADRKYFVIRYNSWKFDYYDEPLIAIVSAMLDSIEQQTELFTDPEIKNKIVSTLKVIAVSLAQKANDVVKEKIGIDAYQMLKNINDTADKNAVANEQKHDYDIYFKFNKALKELQSVLREVSKEHTVIFLVDELDRCLPEYTIKVMERLHHALTDIPNLQAILLVDKQQLDQTVKKIYGDSVNVSGYLAKFIDFDINLPLGNIEQEKFDALFSEYVSCFTVPSSIIEGSTEDLLNELFKYTNIRRRIKIIEKAKLVHSLLPGNKHSLSTDCLAVELFLTTLSFVHNDLSSEWNREIRNFNDIIATDATNPRELLDIHNKVFSESSGNGMSRYVPLNRERPYHTFNSGDIWSMLYVSLLNQYNYVGNEYRCDYVSYYRSVELESNSRKLLAYAKEFADILKLIS